VAADEKGRAREVLADDADGHLEDAPAGDVVRDDVGAVAKVRHFGDGVGGAEDEDLDIFVADEAAVVEAIAIGWGGG
jgi:hypothetical protein